MTEPRKEGTVRRVGPQGDGERGSGPFEKRIDSMEKRERTAQYEMTKGKKRKR